MRVQVKLDYTHLKDAATKVLHDMGVQLPSADFVSFVALRMADEAAKSGVNVFGNNKKESETLDAKICDCIEDELKEILLIHSTTVVESSCEKNDDETNDDVINDSNSFFEG